jgi:hypothetical protein
MTLCHLLCVILHIEFRSMLHLRFLIPNSVALSSLVALPSVVTEHFKGDFSKLGCAISVK